MTTLTLKLDPAAKHFIKTQAASLQMAITDWLLHAIGFSPAPSADYEYTTDDFNEETFESIRQAERGEFVGSYDNVNEMMHDLLADA